MLNNFELEQVINQLLSATEIHDYAPNGLQVEGKKNIQKIVTGVTASQALIDYAVEVNADAIVVHHGYFWKNENPVITGMKYRRLNQLIKNDINLFAYHLPLDVHPQLGNNSQLANLLGLKNLKGLEAGAFPIPVYGELDTAVTGIEMKNRLKDILQNNILHSDENAPSLIKKVGLCSGAGQDFIELAVNFGCDAFITGEVSERTILIAREQGIHFFAGGHHATETFGVKALGEWLADKHELIVEFKDIYNPA